MMTATKTKDKYGSEAARWKAVLERDQQAEGTFYYSVRTTGVYCKPSCPSRTAKRENVGFHDSRADAEKAGFRPCKRCRPDGGSVKDEHIASVANACRLVASSEETPDLETLARKAGMSRFHFQRVFKHITGLTPKAYVSAIQARRMREELPKRRSVTEAIYEAGFNSNGRFYARSEAMLGMDPKKFRGGGPGETIRFAIGECSLGTIVVASSDKGVCAIHLGDDPGALLAELEGRFPKAELIGGDKDYEKLVAKVVGFVEAPGIGLDLPLDVRGTAFQQRVWQALREIPPGTTVSYAALAEKLGSPRAVRAVAGACAANAIGIAIPCHRVVRTDGGLAGYRWGVARKRELLDRETKSGS